MNDFDASVFWPAFQAAGMLHKATDADGDFDVSFKRPGELMLNNGAISNEYQIEYQHADRPLLAEGLALTIEDPHGNALGSFRVRRAPFIDAPGNAADGYFRHALLTKV